jgi:methionyl aminopeptidase
VADVDGFVADSALTVCVPPAAPRSVALVRAARGALTHAIETVRAFRVIREVGGHGVGRVIHEEPHVSNFDDPNARGRLHEGLVLAIEPIITPGIGRLVEAADGWTLRTADRAPVAHAEHTLMVTRGAPIVFAA